MGYHWRKNCRIFSYPYSDCPTGPVDPKFTTELLTSTIKAAAEDSITQLAKNNEKVAFVSGPLIDDINGGKLRLAGYVIDLKRIICATIEGLAPWSQI